MASHEYAFVSRWHIPATPVEAAAILSDAAALPRWWSAVYLAVEPESSAGNPAGGAWRVHSRGWLPYTLRWSFERTHEDLPRAFGLRAWGDLNGTGEWEFHAAPGGGTEASFVWRVRADKPLLRYLSWLFKPIFSANHRWAMAQGELAIAHEAARRRLLQSVRG